MSTVIGNACLKTLAANKGSLVSEMPNQRKTNAKGGQNDFLR